MNIPEHILQQVADEAFNEPIEHRLTTRPYHLQDWSSQTTSRRAVIQHALDNPALAPFLAGGIGEYTDQEISEAWDRYEGSQTYLEGLRAFLSALPRRESQALVEATSPVQTEPAAQVPLGPEDVPPGSTLRAAQGHWFIVLHIEATGVTISNVNGSRFIKWHELKDEGWLINISRPDTGRWDANAWRDCSKPGK